MALHTPYLREFIESVPICPDTISLAAALVVLRQPITDAATLPTRLVLLDERQQAIGWVSSQHLLHHLMVSGLLRQPSLKAPLDNRNLPTADQPLLAIAPSIVAPLTVLSSDLPIDQFLPYLYDQPHACYALTSPEGTFLGLLDSTHLLQFLTDQETAPTVIQTEPLDNSKAESAPLPLNPLLLKLLERLPLPVMLQTRDGRVLAQNILWRDQVGELLDPGWLRQEVAALLEMPAVEGEAVVPQPQHGSESVWEQSILGVQDTIQAMRSLTPLVATQARAEAVPISADYHPSVYHDGAPFEPSAPSASSCYLGSKPGSCVCVCPLKDGQEQVLQFARIPIGTLSSHLSSTSGLDLGDRATSTATTAALFDTTSFIGDQGAAFPFFRLATLVDPVLNSRSIAEPMSLEATNFDTPLATSLLSAPLYVTQGEAAEGGTIAASEELWLILAQDITEQQQLARELTAKNADLIQLNRLKDEFLACVSHELRTPLTAMLGLSSLLKDQTIGTLNQRQVHYAQLIYQSGRQLMAVVNDILDLTRIETGQLELVLEPVEIASVCQRAFDQAQQLRLQEMDQSAAEPTAEEASFTLELEPGMGLLVADEQRLRQMLVHLLSNALKFTELNAPIGLKVGHWGGWVAFTVWDTGIGIPTEKQHLIFQKFQQLENPLTRRFEGTGLGLVLTQRLARLHGGDVTFISKEDQGSQFTILLPPNPPGGGAGYTPPRESIVPSAPSALPFPTNGDALEAPAQPNQLVLIVEAVPHFIELLSDQLAGLGHQVAIARSGTEALEKARRLQPCMIFLNPVLPLLSGWDVLTLLKSGAETRQIPVVVMATQVDEEQSRQRQADSLLSLPVQPKALQKCLQQLAAKLDAATKQPTTVLTVLRLTPGIWSNHHQPIPTADLNVLLHSRQYRVLEADDLEQAELLARVWKPNVVLLDGSLVDEVAYFQEYRQHIVLASLPLVTIDQANAQAANQVPGLLVFPYLSTLEAQLSTSQDTETSALLQVIQVAAGYARRPSILAVNAATLPLSLAAVNPQNLSESILGSTPQETEWLQALMQYLNVAGLRGLVGRCWQEVLQQIESRSVDVLLISWTDATPQSCITEMLSTLQQSQKRPPVLVLDHRSQKQMTDADAIAPLPTTFSQIAATILPASLSMSELLTQIHQVIRVTKR